MVHILLTGGSGFVGRQILRSLKARGHRVSVTSRPGKPLPDGFAADAVIETPDLFAESEAWWAERLAGVDTIIHSAWYVEPGKYLDSPKNLDCVTGTLALARAAVSAGVRHLIGVGTCMEYRLPSDHLDISQPLDPATLYAAAKLSLYHLLDAYLTKTGTRFSWCRLFYLYGEGGISGPPGALCQEPACKGRNRETLGGHAAA